MVGQITQIDQLKSVFLGCLFQSLGILRCTEIIIDGIGKGYLDVRAHDRFYRINRSVNRILDWGDDMKRFHLSYEL